jgi:hypothetical protein
MHKNKSLAFWLFLLVFISGAYFYPGGGQNEAARYDTIRSVLEDHTFAVDNYTYNSADLIKYKMHFYSSKAPGTFIIGILPFAISKFLLDFIPMDPNLRLHLICYLTSVFSITVLAALCAPLIFLLLLRLGAQTKQAIAVALAINLATILFPFSTVFFSHAATATVAFASFYFLFSHPEKEYYLLLAGFAAGFAILLEYPAAIISVALLIYTAFIYKNQVRRQLIVGAGFALAMLLLMTYNYLSFQNPFFIPYEAYATESNPVFEAHRHGILGIRLPFFEPHFFPTFISNLAEITYQPLRGIFFCNPILVLIFPGFYFLFREKFIRRECLFILFITLSYFIFNASYGDSIVYWGGGTSFGPRHLIPILPFLSIPLFSCIKQKPLAPLFAGLGFISLFFCLMATAVEPRAPYGPRNIIFDYYLPHFLKNEISLTKEGIFSSVGASEVGSTAFNWGSALHLTPAHQLWPLYFFWLVSAFYLIKKAGLPKTAPAANETKTKSGPLTL